MRHKNGELQARSEEVQMGSWMIFWLDMSHADDQATKVPRRSRPTSDKSERVAHNILVFRAEVQKHEIENTSRDLAEV